MKKEEIERIALEVANTIAATYITDACLTRFAHAVLARIDAERGKEVAFVYTGQTAEDIATIFDGYTFGTRFYAAPQPAPCPKCAEHIEYGTRNLRRRSEELAEVCAERDALQAKVAVLKEGISESDAVRERCARLLAETAVALKGPEAALHRHGWQDLPEFSAKLVSHVAEQAALIEKCEKALNEIAEWGSHSPEYDADYGSNGIRDLYRSIARQALSSISLHQKGNLP